jgi:copper chaperone CopZ
MKPEGRRLLGWKETNMATNQDTVLAVEGINCGCCAGRIERALDSLGGTSKVSVDLGQSTVTVKHDVNRTSTAALISALRDAGYESKVVR